MKVSVNVLHLSSEIATFQGTRFIYFIFELPTEHGAQYIVSAQEMFVQLTQTWILNH